MTKSEILETAINIGSSPSFIDDNYTPSTIHQLYDDTFQYIVDEFEDYGIDYTEEEIAKYLQNNLEISK